MTKGGEKTLPEALLAAAAPVLLQKAVVDGDAVNGLMSAGMVAGRLSDLPSCETLLANIESEARERIATLTGALTPINGAV
jgi:NAD(P)H-dependent flavin oxidoreductase YrpB (nitropropane dioxygenase family)